MNRQRLLTIENTRGHVDPCVYILTAPNGRIYVGSAFNGFHERASAYRNEKAHSKLNNALKKYGAKNFVFSILESSNTWQKDKLQEREQHYMDTLLPFGARGYNIERVAGVVEVSTRRVSQFTRAGEPVASFESLVRASVVAGVQASSIGACCMGKLASAGGFAWLYSEDAAPQEIARRVEQAADKKQERPVSQYTRAGVFVASYPSAVQASCETRGNKSCISVCAPGKIPSAAGFIWLYSEEATPNEIARRVERAASVTSSDKRRVSQYTKAGEFVTSYPSASEAARATSGNKSNITACCKGKRKTTGGFVWKYDSPRLVEPVKALEPVETIDTRETCLEAVAREWEQVSLVF